ncbi:thioredoxin family protein [Gammaproteobacteria bacterium]|nr:thioredoxin family protein [Gammaproteobacteria bacterium]MDB9896852.1 thioredoxin family protein [Gammaproteobacteria bacterium]MDC1359644.1 thioredoxin family protein [Gammaproteobacteria bacterium]MDC1484940.1 thioredoxin family protein [Gammaproteobacteria bacterium]MDC3381824.1 thioredoxin family protein [Gammaproteobacteria bacterium]
MKKIFQLFFLSLFAYSCASETYPMDPYAVGDISIKTLFENHEGFQDNYEEYQPGNLLDPALFRGVEIYMLFGTWCHDSKREVPRLLSLLNKLDVPENQINLIGLNFKKNDSQDRGKKFQIKKTPTFVFLRNQKEIGRIVEMPEISLEADLLKILGSLD